MQNKGVMWLSKLTSKDYSLALKLDIVDLVEKAS